MKKIILGLFLVLLASCADNSEVFVMNEYWFNHYKKTCTRYCAVFGDNYKFDSIRIIKEDRKKIRETCECSTTKGAATWYKYIDIVDQS